MMETRGENTAAFINLLINTFFFTLPRNYQGEIKLMKTLHYRAHKIHTDQLKIAGHIKPALDTEVNSSPS